MNRAYNHPDAVPVEEMNRRDFLKLCAVGALPGLLAACQSGPSKPGVTNLSSPTGQPSPTGTDWSELASSLQGTLIRPGSPYYPTARQLFNPRFDSVQPAGIAYCATPADVQTCLAFAQRYGIPLDRVRFEYGDLSSAGAGMVSAAVHNATTVLRNQLIAQAIADDKSPLHNADPNKVVVSDGRMRRRDQPGIGETYGELLQRHFLQDTEALGSWSPPAMDTPYGLATFGAQFAEVAVDADLGLVRVRRMVRVFAPGRVLNAKTARSQLMGECCGDWARLCLRPPTWAANVVAGRTPAWVST